MELPNIDYKEQLKDGNRCIESFYFRLTINMVFNFKDKDVSKREEAFNSAKLLSIICH